MISEKVPRKTFPCGCWSSQCLYRPAPPRAATAPLTQRQAVPALQGLILPKAQWHIPAISLGPAPASVCLSGG